MQTSSIVNGGAFGTHQMMVQNESQPDPNATILELGLTGYQRVKRFMTVMGQSVPERPQWPSEADFRLRVKLDLEEFFEKLYKGYFLGNPVEILDGAVDVEYVGTGSLVTFGVDYDLAMAEVDRSNLSKLDDNGRPIINDGVIDPEQPVGKVLKSARYSPPNLVQFLHGLEEVEAPYSTAKIVHEELCAIMHKYATSTALFMFRLPTKGVQTDAEGDRIAREAAQQIFGASEMGDYEEPVLSFEESIFYTDESDTDTIIVNGVETQESEE